MKVLPGSDRDNELYVKAKALDELFTLLDTMDTQATIAEKNRQVNSPLNDY